MRKIKFYKRYRPKVKRKKSIFKKRFFWSFCLIFVVLGIFFYFLFFSSFFQVKEIIISGNEKVSEKEILIIIEKNLEKKFFFLSTKSIFLTNLSKIKKEILNNIPKIASVEISRGFPNSLSIFVKERVGLANFCKKEKCFLLDENGVIFEKAQYQNHFLEIEDKREIDFSLDFNQKVLEKSYLEQISRIKKYIDEKFEFGVKKFIIFDEYLKIQTTQDWEIYFDPEEDLNWQLTKLELVLKEKIPPQKRRNLEYIELRFGNLATFKWKNN
jgi:cell division septal protein FtsQ